MPQKTLQKIHFFFGVIVFIIFVYTGQVIQKNYSQYTDIASIGLFNRMSHLAGHIFILFSSFLNIILGAYFQLSDKMWIRLFQLIGSFLIILATSLLIFSFFTELPAEEMNFFYRKSAVITIAIGIGLHSLYKVNSLFSNN